MEILKYMLDHAPLTFTFITKISCNWPSDYYIKGLQMARIVHLLRFAETISLVKS